MSVEPANQLGRETSPYLLQHAHQPVNWRAWNEASLSEAREHDHPIFLSIGYAACHWCHVMAHESFDDPDIGSLLNRHFVSIKVDREERPDIDQMYMTALHAMGEQGGWPLTMFLTPRAEPFWGGTYFPPEARWGRPSFRTVLQAVADAYAGRDPAVLRNAALLSRAVRAAAHGSTQRFPDIDQITRAGASILRLTDAERGGFRGAPKFPNFPTYRFLAQRAGRGDAGARAAVRTLLDALCRGGIFDHLGGGMFRYATDAVWLVPHFEKMLYDNAQFLDALALAYADAPDPDYHAAAAATVACMLRDLDADGSFAASLDADTPAGEGAFYVWTETEIDAALGERAAPFKAAYDVTPQGNWEGRTILRRHSPAADDQPPAIVFEAELAILAATRHGRPRPALDDKVLADWNGLAIAALCRAASVFERPDWLNAGRQRYARLTDRLRLNGRWQHAWRNGVISAAGLLDDLAAVGNAALALYEATGEDRFRADAEAIVDEADTWYGPAAEGYAMTAADVRDIPEALATRPRSAVCTAVPSGSGMMAQLLARLHHLTGRPGFRERGRAVIEAFAGRFDQPTSSATLLAAAEMLEDGVVVVVAGEPDLPATHALLAQALATGDPACCVLRLAPGDVLPEAHPAQGKSAPPGKALAYVCRGGACQPPTDDPATLRLTLSPPSVA